MAKKKEIDAEWDKVEYQLRNKSSELYRRKMFYKFIIEKLKVELTALENKINFIQEIGEPCDIDFMGYVDLTDYKGELDEFGYPKLNDKELAENFADIFVLRAKQEDLVQ